MVELYNYLEQLTYGQTSWSKKLEQYAKANHIPIMDKVSMQFLIQLILIHQPLSILEIGTAIGYSALRIHHFLPSANIVSIEKNQEMFQLAEKHIKQFRQKDTIELIHGDGIKVIEEFVNKRKTFDFIFIDAAKAHYKSYFDISKRILNDHGIIVCDNVLFKGYVYQNNDKIPKRLQRIANKMTQFNHWLMEQEKFMTTILPIGDGLSISVKKKL